MEEEIKNGKFSWLQWIPAIISAIGAIIVAWFTYNQTTHDKMTDFKIEQMKSEQVYQMNLSNELEAKINGYLWRLLENLDCQRVFITQAHPTKDPKFISVTFEVRRPGISQIKDSFKNILMSDIPLTADVFSNSNKIDTNTEYLYIPNVNKSKYLDDYTKSIFTINGIEELVVIKLVDSHNVWAGNLICSHDEDRHFAVETIGADILKTSRDIQYLLPNYNP